MKLEAVKTLDISQKAAIKRALIRAGVNPSGMNDHELIEAHKLIELPKEEVKPEAPKERVNATSKDATKLAHLITELMASSAVLDETRVIELIKEHSKAPLSFEIKHENKTPITIESAHFQFAKVLQWLTSGNALYLAGPAGSGKTTIAEQCAQALDVPFHPVGSIFQKYELTGYSDAHGIFRTTEFREAFEHGGLFLFDEIDASDASALVAFNAAIANGFFAFPDKIIKMHENFKVIAAANTKGKGATREYCGRNPLDTATIDRFAILDIEYDEKLELEIAQALCDQGDKICRTVQSVRAKATLLNLSCVISPRATYQAAKAVRVGIPINEALEATLWNKLDTTTRKQLEA